MIHLHVAVVGDGLAAAIYTPFCGPIQIDCGSRQNSGRGSYEALKRVRPDAFFLSHFHTDHYNGLFHASSNDSFDIRQIFFPRLPIFPKRQAFIQCLLAMGSRVMGDRSGSPEADFISVVQRINRRGFTYTQLSLGDTAEVAGARFDMLWPPKILTDSRTLKVIQKAIHDFEEAKESDEELRRLYDVIGETGKVQPYLSEDDNGEKGREPANDFRGRRTPQPTRELPNIVDRANRSLSDAANHFSLALHEDNRLLFMGDLERREIRKVVSELEIRRRTHFVATITPHHGTHWDETLRRLTSVWAISSLGDRLIGNFCPEFKTFANFCLTTHANGNISLPSLHPVNFELLSYWPRWWQPRF